MGVDLTMARAMLAPYVPSPDGPPPTLFGISVYEYEKEDLVGALNMLLHQQFGRVLQSRADERHRPGGR